MSARDLDLRGLSVSDLTPSIDPVHWLKPGRSGEVVLIPRGIDPGFSHNAGLTGHPVVGWTPDAELLADAVWMADMYAA